MKAFVDSSVFVRLLTGNDPEKAQRSYDLFARAQRGKIELQTSEAIVAEVLFVLSSPRLYGVERSRVAEAMRPVLELRGLRLDHKQSVLAALTRWATANLDFPDCVAVEHALRASGGTIYSYDRDFDRITRVERREP